MCMLCIREAKAPSRPSKRRYKKKCDECVSRDGGITRLCPQCWRESCVIRLNVVNEDDYDREIAIYKPVGIFKRSKILVVSKSIQLGDDFLEKCRYANANGVLICVCTTRDILVSLEYLIQLYSFLMLKFEIVYLEQDVSAAIKELSLVFQCTELLDYVVSFGVADSISVFWNENEILCVTSLLQSLLNNKSLSLWSFIIASRYPFVSTERSLTLLIQNTSLK